MLDYKLSQPVSTD